jgi:hypothetical protein
MKGWGGGHTSVKRSEDLGWRREGEEQEGGKSGAHILGWTVCREQELRTGP